MKIGIIGRGQWTYETAKILLQKGYEIPVIITAKAPEEYPVKEQDFEKLAKEIKAKYLCTAKIKSQEALDLLNSVDEMDICVSVNYSGVIPDEIINKFKIGILNAHGGDLPKYRGNACQAWAIINGEEKIGICIHKMIGGELDSGDIIGKKYMPININTRLKEVYDWFDEVIPSMFLEAVEQLKTNPNYCTETQSKDPKDALRCYPRMPEDGAIDWSKSNIEIVRLINASSEPYAGAFCEYDGKKLTLWRAHIQEDEEIYVGIKGQVSRINHESGEIDVICGTGKITISEIELEKNRTKPTTFIKSIRTRLK